MRLLLVLAAGFGAAFSLAQEAGPLPPAPAASAPADAGHNSAAETCESSQWRRCFGYRCRLPRRDLRPTARVQLPVLRPLRHAASAVTPTAAAAAKIMVPAGTHIPLVLHNAISTRSARPGDPVYFETLFPVMIDGKVVIPAGSYVSGEVTESKRPGRVKGRGELMIKLTNMILPNAYHGEPERVPGERARAAARRRTAKEKSSAIRKKGRHRNDREDDGGRRGHRGITARIRAGVGIGAAAGAAVGLAAVLLTRGPDAELPRGSTVEAVIDRSLYLDADKISSADRGKLRRWRGRRIANRCAIDDRHFDEDLSVCPFQADPGAAV